MTNVQTVVDIITRHYGGWTRNEEGVVICRGYGCNYAPKLGEFHGEHVAKDILATLGLPE